jgi:hypothetical protein
VPESSGIDPLPPFLGPLAEWLGAARERISAQVTVRETKRASGANTTVTIDHRLSCDLDDFAGWHVSTAPALLPRAHFSSYAKHLIKTAAQHGRGRALYCHDPLAQEVVSALSYHIDDDERKPVLLTALGFRTDTGENRFLSERTLSGALVLKHHVHAIAAKIGRGGYVDIDVGSREHVELVSQLGFRRAPKIKGFKPGGTHLRQPR